MISTPTVAAIVPMRHASERVTGKNYRELAGKPLYHYIVETLQQCAAVTKIVIDTDSAAIQSDAASHFPEVAVVERPQHLRDGHIPMNDVLLYRVDELSADFILQTHSTNPLLRVSTLERALNDFLAAYPGHDSMFSVTRLQTRLWMEEAKPLNHDPNVLLRTQDLPPVFEENSCFYIFPPDLLRERRNRIGRSPLMFEVPLEEAWDIDEEIDFAITECLMTRRLKV